VAFHMSTEGHDDKYVTFNAQEFMHWFATEVAPMCGNSMPIPIPDAVVLRRQDRFAAGAFEAYADQIIAMLDLFEDAFYDVDIPADRWDPDAMRAVADYFRDQAHASRQGITKVPTP
jgi:hypothetical protein